MMTDARLVVLVLALGLVLSGGCGDDSSSGNNTNTNGNDNTNTNGNGVNPVLIPGGGVSSGAIAGTLHVHVIDAADDSPLSGATVAVGDAGSTPLTMTTNGAGLATFDGVTGAQVVTAGTTGYAAVSWYGVNGANVTLPLVRSPAPPVQTAVITGTIEGWDSMQDPTIGDYRAAIVNYSHTDNILDPANSIEQPVDGEGLGLNVCLWYFLNEDPCNWSVTTRTGPQIVYATIVIGDPNGTPTDISDDTMTVIGYAALGGLNPTAGQTVNGQQLLQMNDTSNVTVSFGTPPAGLGDVTAVPYLVTASEGRVPAFIFTPTMASALLPNPTGPFAGGFYDVIGVANTTGPTDTESSLSFLRNVNVGSGVSLPAWMAPPTGLAANAGTYSFTPSAGANVHTLTFSDGNGAGTWVVMLLDGRTSFSAPDAGLPLLPTGTVTLVSAEMEVPGFDPANFNTPAMADTVSRTATSQITFTP